MKSLKNYNKKNNYNKLEVSTENQFEQILITFFPIIRTPIYAHLQDFFCNTHTNLFDFFFIRCNLYDKFIIAIGYL